MKNKTKKRVLFIIVFIILIIIFIKSNKTNNSNDTTFTPEKTLISDSLASKVLTNNDNIYIYNQSLVKMINNNEVVWQDNFASITPTAFFSKNKFAIADLNEKTLKLYNNKGLIYTIKTVYPIVSFSINDKGYTSIITKNENLNEVDVYNEKGENIFSLKDISILNGIPVATTVSEDCENLAISFLKVNKTTVDSYIGIYSLKKEILGQDKNSMFAAFEKEDQLVGIIRFMSNNNLLTFSDKEIACSKISPKSNVKYREIWKNPLEQKIQYMSIIDNKNFVLVFDEDVLKEDEKTQKSKIVFYNINNIKTKSYTSEKKITSFYSSEIGTLIGIGRKYVAINNNGKEVWTYHLTQDINDIKFFKNINTIIISSDQEVYTIKISQKTIKNNEQIIKETNTTSEEATQDLNESVEKTSETTSKTISEEKNETNHQEKNENTQKKLNWFKKQTTTTSLKITNKAPPL